MSEAPNASQGISYIIPVYNEENAIIDTVQRLKRVLGNVSYPFEIIVVDDGSKDLSAEKARGLEGTTVLRHPDNSGYGRALKSGIAVARYDWIGTVDADGTYEIEKIPDMVAAMEEGFDMVVASRQNLSQRDSLLKKLMRLMYVTSIRVLVGRNVIDPNSGLRIFSRDVFSMFSPFLCNSFSFTTSLTVFAFGGAYFVKYIPSHYEVREGKSKVRHFRDTLRTIQLIVQGVTFFNPIKLYLLLAFTHLVFVGIPSIALSLWFPALAAPVLTIGSVALVLLGLGALGDIIRVSMIRPGDLYNSRQIAGRLKTKTTE